MVPIGHVRGGRTEATDDHWGGVRAAIVLDASALSPEATLGLDAFSHIEVLFVMDRVPDAEIESGARHPRGRRDWPRVGILAQRGKGRPNRIGLSRCRIVSVAPGRIEVEGLDAIDGSPVLDIKPWMEEFAPRGATRQPVWATELMARYYDTDAPDA